MRVFLFIAFLAILVLGAGMVVVSKNLLQHTGTSSSRQYQQQQQQQQQWQRQQQQPNDIRTSSPAEIVRNLPDPGMPMEDQGLIPSTPPPGLPPELTNDPNEPAIDPFVGDNGATTPDSPVAANPVIRTDGRDRKKEKKKKKTTAALVISEIMYHPPHEPLVAENTNEEFVELYNPTDSAIELAGYRFTRGVDFTFPPEARVEAKGFLTVAAHPETFTAKYGKSVPVVGGWTGRLSNSGEEILLRNAEGEEVNSVAYFDQGDWAVRTRQQHNARYGNSPFSSNNSRRSVGRNNRESGWGWETSADGLGSSLELINPFVNNDNGQNWGPSKASHGTPGKTNSIGNRNTGPVIRGVRHEPAIPSASDTVTVRARLADESGSTLSATLHWRVSAWEEEPFQQTPMEETGNGKFSAAIPPQGTGSVVEFFVLASDGQYKRTWPAPTSTGQDANALYLVDQIDPSEKAPVYRLVFSTGDHSSFPRNPHSDNQANATFITDTGTGPEIRYRCGVRVRGSGSRSHNPPPIRINVPRDRRWQDYSRLNLNSKYTWLQYLGMKCCAHAGLHTPEAISVKLLFNGEDRTRGSRSQYDYGRFVHLEPLGSEFVEKHFPDDPNGNAYKKVRPDNDWAWHRGDVMRYRYDGWIKHSNASKEDWTDLDNFLKVMHSGRRNSGGQYLESVNQVGDIDQWLLWFGTQSMLVNGENGLANGVDDDYGMYRGAKDARFKFLPHDLDTILGIGDSSRIRNPEHTLFDVASYSNTIGPMEPFFRHPEIKKRYYQVLGRLIETTFSEKTFDNLVDQHISDWVPSQRCNEVKRFMAQRRAYVASQVQRHLGNEYEPVAKPLTRASEEKKAGQVVINEILADNQSSQALGDRYSDVVELHNSGSNAADLEGYALSDNPERPDKFIFPSGTSIPAGGYLVLTSGQSGEALEFNFGLENGGESLTLFHPEKNGKREIADSILFGPQLADHSIGRTGKNQTWTLTSPSPGAANSPDKTSPADQLTISEWLAAPEIRYSEDFLEIHNPLAQPVAIGGLGISDDPVTAPWKKRLPDLSFIGPDSYLVFDAKGKQAREDCGTDLPFKISALQGWLAITAANKVEIDKVSYECQKTDLSQGRLNPRDRTYKGLPHPTPGRANTSKEETTLDTGNLLASSLRISEIMYRPEDKNASEFIELLNIGSTAIQLEGVRFSKGIKFTFPSHQLEPGTRILVVEDRKGFPDGTPIVGEYEGKLNNGGEKLLLQLPAPSDASILQFTFKDGWHPSSDGKGKSLVVADPQAEIAAWTRADGWTASEENGGSPGR